MKIIQLAASAFLSLLLLQANAQTAAPKGFINGKVLLAGNTEASGFIKDNIRKDAAVTLFSNGKETVYNGSDISGAVVGTDSYICIRGDFFKVLCQGDLYFLQKASNASSKPTYVGNEVMFISGTEGKPGDYFLYKGQELQLVSKKNLDNIAADNFAGFAPAIEKAKAAKTNIADLKEAVELYNKRNG